LSLQVHAIADDNKRTSEATVVIEIEDINDNSPQFSQEVRTNDVLGIYFNKRNEMYAINCV
jgi:hypothetical protein